MDSSNSSAGGPEPNGSDYSPAAVSKPVQRPRPLFRHGWAAFSASIQQRLARVTTSKTFIPEIDGLRFLAIMTVVLLHLCLQLAHFSPVAFSVPPEQDWWWGARANGVTGVYVFFAISGFILALPFAMQYLRQGRPVKLKDYYWRRVTRLEPPYILAMLLFFVVQVVIVHKSAVYLLPHLGASLVYLHCLIYGTKSDILTVAWSLETEVQFYLLAPVIALFFTIQNKYVRRTGLLAMLLLLLALAMWGYDLLGRFHLNRSIFIFGHFFLAGFLFADLFATDLGGKVKTSLGWDVVAIAAVLTVFAVPYEGWNMPLITLAIFLLFPAVFGGTFMRRFFCNGWITVVGGMCYTIYLLHNPFIAFMITATKHISLTREFAVNYLLQAIIVLPCLLLVSATFFLLVEKPCMYKDWPQRLAAWFRAKLQPRPA